MNNHGRVIDSLFRICGRASSYHFMGKAQGILIQGKTNENAGGQKGEDAEADGNETGDGPGLC